MSRRVLVLVALALAAPACKSPEDYREDADEEVAAILAARRAELGATDDFDVVAAEGSLRARILAGEVEELEGLSLVDCLRIAAENSRAYQDRREALFLEALDLTRTRWDFDWQETAAGDGSVSGDFNQANVGSGAGGLGISKLFASGAQFFADVSLEFTRSLANRDGWDAISGLTLDITQPLLRDFGDEITLEPLTQAERDVLYEARAYERFRRTFAFDVASRYFRILEQRDTLRNERANQESLQRLRERNEAFAEAGRLSDIQVDQARQNELAADDSVVAAEQRLETLLDDFKLFLGLPIETPLQLAATTADELEIQSLIQDVVPEGFAVTTALTQRLDFHTVVERVNDAERDVRVAEDDLRARFDLTGNLSVTSREGQPLTTSSTGGSWTLGAVIDLPIDNLPERNAYRESLIGLEAARRSEEDFRDSITADIRAELRDLIAQGERLAIQTGAVELAQRRVESTLLNQEAGRADTRDVLEAQEDLVAAENRATQALTDYTLAGLALFRDMGLLRVDADGVRVERTLLP